MLAAKLQIHEELAQTREEFAKRILQKEVEVVRLNAELQIANQRTKMSQEIGEAVVEYERVKVSSELVRDLNDNLKLEIAQLKTHQSEALAASKADNARLTERIANLEEHLESINVRLAKKPTDNQVK